MRSIVSSVIALVLASCADAEPDEIVAPEVVAPEVAEPDMPAPQVAALVDVNAVLGFESADDWSVSQGVKSASSEASQGARALGIAGFTYTELRSPRLPTLPGVGATLAFDLRLPVAPDWGQAQLFVDLPSQGLYNTFVGQVPLAGSPAGAYQTVSFPLSPALIAVLSRAYDDLTLKIALNLPQQSAPTLIDALRFVGQSSEPSSIALAISNVDDFVYLTINGVRRATVTWHTELSRDVRSWFAAGLNTVRIQAINTGGPASFAAQLTVDGQTVIDARCDVLPCTAGTAGGAGILFDQTYQVVVPRAPAASTLTIAGDASQKIYLNDAYTGRSAPASFTLPQGTYTVGVGIGDGGPGAYAGRYHEQTVQLGERPMTIAPAQSSPLALPNHTRIAILPIRRTIHGDGGEADTGILSEADVTVLHGQAEATRAAWVEPFSYGLTTWDIEVLPIEETTPIYRAAASDQGPDVGRFLRESNLGVLEQRYDTIVYLFSEYTSTGALVAHPGCCFWGGGQLVAFPTKTTRDGASASEPNVYLLHEVLHDYESFNGGRLGFYNGTGGLHGSAPHGYHAGDGGEADFLLFYRLFMRNQVAELNTMRDGVDWTTPPPSDSDLYIGVFDTMRRDVQWSTAPALTTSAASTSVEACEPE